MIAAVIMHTCCCLCYAQVSFVVAIPALGLMKYTVESVDADAAVNVFSKLAVYNSPKSSNTEV